MIYQHNTMWIDCMMLLPLVALGIEKLISEKKYKLFTLSLGLAIFTNFYIGYMMCIFCFIYFFYAYFCIDKNPLGEKKHFLRALVRMGLFSAIAVGLAACIILPTYYSLGFGKTTFSDPTYSYKPRFDLLDLAAKLFLNSYDTVRPEGLPILYCGIMSSGVAYTLQILGQRDLNPAIASLIMCLESVFSALGGWMLLHQNLSAREVFGCVLIFAAVVLAQLPLEMLHRAKKTT